MTSVPIRRIQAVLFEATPVRRVFRLAALRVNTAGFGTKENDKATASALVPIARSAELRMLLHNLLPEADVIPLTRPAPRRALRFYIVWPTSLAIGITLIVVGGPLAANAAYGFSEPLLLTTPLILAVAVLVVGGAVASLRALTWHSTGYGVSGNALAIDYGTLGSYKVRITRSRIQSLSVRQSLFQRRARLATLVVASVSGSSRALFKVQHLDHADALKIERWYSPDASAEPLVSDVSVAAPHLPSGQLS
jgi:putative membrane protein